MECYEKKWLILFQCCPVRFLHDVVLALTVYFCLFGSVFGLVASVVLLLLH